MCDAWADENEREKEKGMRMREGERSQCAMHGPMRTRRRESDRIRKRRYWMVRLLLD